MRILIVDDEALARERLKSLLAELAVETELLEAANGLEALQICQQQPVQTLLLDIRMPAMDGIEVARHLGQTPHPPSIIFTTAYDQHALAAFENHAVDYLLKPVKLERLRQALEKASLLNQSQLHGLQDATQSTRRHLSAQQQGQMKLIPVREVRYLQADHKYVTAVSADTELLLEDSLKSLEKEFPDDFLRIHRNALVALRYVESVEKDSDGAGLIRLRGISQPLSVSRRHLAQVKRQLKQKP